MRRAAAIAALGLLAAVLAGCGGTTRVRERTVVVTPSQSGELPRTSPRPSGGVRIGQSQGRLENLEAHEDSWADRSGRVNEQRSGLAPRAGSGEAVVTAVPQRVRMEREMTPAATQARTQARANVTCFGNAREA